jgi:hypothetical protein
MGIVSPLTTLVSICFPNDEEHDADILNFWLPITAFMSGLISIFDALWRLICLSRTMNAGPPKGVVTFKCACVLQRLVNRYM